MSRDRKPEAWFFTECEGMATRRCNDKETAIRLHESTVGVWSEEVHGGNRSTELDECDAADANIRDLLACRGTERGVLENTHCLDVRATDDELFARVDLDGTVLLRGKVGDVLERDINRTCFRRELEVCHMSDLSFYWVSYLRAPLTSAVASFWASEAINVNTDN